MIIIHKITPTVDYMDPFYVRYPDPSKVSRMVEVKGIGFLSDPIQVHEAPWEEAGKVSWRVWTLPGVGLWFTTDVQAHTVFMALYGRSPDLGTELRSYELRTPSDNPEPY